MDFRPYREKYGRFAVEHRDWLVDAKAFGEIRKRGPDARGAGGLVWDQQGHILLVRHEPEEGWGDAWAPPGGLAERDEAPEACFLRETKEETGLDVRITALSKVFVYYVSHGGVVLPYTFFQFEAESEGATPRPGREIAQVAWFDRFPDDLHFRADYIEAWMRRRPRL